MLCWCASHRNLFIYYHIEWPKYHIRNLWCWIFWALLRSPLSTKLNVFQNYWRFNRFSFAQFCSVFSRMFFIARESRKNFLCFHSMLLLLFVTVADDPVTHSRLIAHRTQFSVSLNTWLTHLTISSKHMDAISSAMKIHARRIRSQTVWFLCAANAFFIYY